MEVSRYTDICLLLLCQSAHRCNSVFGPVPGLVKSAPIDRRHLSIDYSGLFEGPSAKQRESDEADALARRLDAGIKLNAQDEWSGAIIPNYAKTADG